MKIDTHVHLLTSKATRPDWNEIAFSLDVAKINGLDALCVTEHRDAVGYEELLDGLFCSRKVDGEVLRAGVFRLANGLVLSSGAEIALRGGGDCGVHAAPDMLLALPAAKAERSGSELIDTLAPAAAEAVSVLHHALIPGKWPVQLEQWVDRVDAVEVPGKHPESAEAYRALASRFDKPTVTGSDAHTWIQFGICMTEIAQPDPEQFSPAMLKSHLNHTTLQAAPRKEAERLLSLSRKYRLRLEQQYSVQ